jgi:hypothetical protein
MRWFGPVWIALTVATATVRGVGGRADSDPNAPEGSEASDKSHFDMARGWVVLPIAFIRTPDRAIFASREYSFSSVAYAA